MPTDTYPVKGGSPFLTFKNLFIVGLILVVIYLVTCNRSPVVDTPDKPTKEQVITVIKDTLREKFLRDSFAGILHKEYAKDDKNNEELVRLVNENTQLYNDNQKLQSTIDYPDTCKEVVNKLNDAYNKYATQTGKTLAQSKTTITGLASTINQQKKALKSSQDQYKILRKDADTCLFYSQVKDDKIKKLNKRELGAGVSSIMNYTSLKPEFGVTLYYRSLKGLTVSAGYYTGSVVSLTISKPILKWK